MAKPRRTWRTKIDDLIESEITKAGFEAFDGIAYSFAISEEVLGIVQIYNQTSKYGKVALINTNFGIIHYQAGVLLSQLRLQPPYSLHSKTLCNQHSNFKLWIPYFELSENLDWTDTQVAIEKAVTRLKEEAVPYLTNNFKTVADIASYLDSCKYPNCELLCLALAAAKQIPEALEIAQQNLCRYDEPTDTIVPTPFKYKFDEWLKAGAKMPDLVDAREKTFAAARERQKEVANIPPRSRPTY